MRTPTRFFGSALILAGGPFRPLSDLAILWMEGKCLLKNMQNGSISWIIDVGQPNSTFYNDLCKLGTFGQDLKHVSSRIGWSRPWHLQSGTSLPITSVAWLLMTQMASLLLTPAPQLAVLLRTIQAVQSPALQWKVSQSLWRLHTRTSDNWWQSSWREKSSFVMSNAVAKLCEQESREEEEEGSK